MTLGYYPPGVRYSHLEDLAQVPIAEREGYDDN